MKYLINNKKINYYAPEFKYKLYLKKKKYYSYIFFKKNIKFN